MNILFASGYFGAIPIANNVVAMRLAEAFTAKGHRCFISGLSPECIGTETLADGTQLTRVAAAPILEKPLEKYHRFQQNNPGKTAKDFTLRHPIAAGIIGLLNGRYFNSPKGIVHYTKQVETLIATEKIDVVITMCFPFDVAHALLQNLKADVTKLYYQLDPHGLHVYYSGDEKAERIRLECEAMAGADLVFTTNELYPQYQADAHYQPYLDKCTPVGFPVFYPPKQGDKALAGFAEDCINVVFCGNLDHKMREPSFMLQQIELLIQMLPNVKFHFAGSHEGGLILEVAARYPEQFILLGGVPSDVADNLVNSADVLLNIGNMANNMVPSKIFTYFATGKPILNFQKIIDCPNLPYFEKYPLAFTLCEAVEEDKTKTAELAAFILEHYRTRIPYAQSARQYQAYTLSVVAENMLTQMEHCSGIL